MARREVRIVKYLLVVVLILFPQLALAEIEYIDLVAIEGGKLRSITSVYELSEESSIKNMNGDVVSLSDISFPATVKVDIDSSEKGNILNWIILMDRANNEQLPE
jgi:hypothetical protein